MRKEKKARACPPPLLCEFALPLGRKGHKVGDNTKAGSPLIHSNKGCVPYCLSLAESAQLSSNSVKQLRFVCESGCGNWRQRAPSQRTSGGKQRRKDDDEETCRWLALRMGAPGLECGGGGGGRHTQLASGECSSGGDVTAPRKMPGIDVTVLSQPASACNSAHSLARTRSFDPGKRKMALSQHTHTLTSVQLSESISWRVDCDAGGFCSVAALAGVVVFVFAVCCS